MFLAPSRHLNRPKPWVFWKGGDIPADRAATTTIPYFHLPPSRDGTSRGACTLPDGYYYNHSGGIDTLNNTLSTHYSDRKY